MKGVILTLGILLSAGASASCIKYYQHRIDNVDEWAHYGKRWPSQARARVRRTQAAINIIDQAKRAEYQRYPGGKELVEMSYDLNRYRSLTAKRITLDWMAYEIRKANSSRVFCRNYRDIFLLKDIKRYLRKLWREQREG